jgi:hypothetical protein
LDYVKDFGAIGDGVTDDTESFINSINYINSVLMLGKCPILLIPTGVYIISDTLTLNFFTRIKTLGFVKLYFTGKSKSCLFFDHISKTENTFNTQGFYQSPLIDATNGALLLLSSSRDNKSIGIEFGSNDNSITGGNWLKNGFRFVEIEAFDIGIKYNNCNNYLTHFTDMGVRNNNVGIQFGDVNNTVVNNSGENISFRNFTLGGNGCTIKNYFNIPVKFYDSSFDMNKCVLDAKNNFNLMLYNCHIERNGLTSWGTVNYEKLGLFINDTENTVVNLELNDVLITYGDESEGSELTDNLIRGNITINPKNLKIEMNPNFVDGTMQRLFLCKQNVNLRKTREIKSEYIIPSYKSAININSCFQNLENGLVGSFNDFADKTVNKIGEHELLNVTQTSRLQSTTITVENSYFINNDKSKHLVFDYLKDGEIKFLSDFIDVEYGQYLRPVIICKFGNNTFNYKGVQSGIYLYDSNRNEVSSDITGYQSENDFMCHPRDKAIFVPYNVKYAKIYWRVYAGGLSTGSSIGKIYLENISLYKW